MEKENEHKGDCCANKQNSNANPNNSNVKQYVLIGIVGLVLVFSIIQSFQISTLKMPATGGSIASVSGQMDMSGWTDDEKMMYEHHGTLPSRLQGAAPQQSGMVGGC